MVRGKKRSKGRVGAKGKGEETKGKEESKREEGLEGAKVGGERRKLRGVKGRACRQRDQREIRGKWRHADRKGKGECGIDKRSKGRKQREGAKGVKGRACRPNGQK